MPHATTRRLTLLALLASLTGPLASQAAGQPRPDPLVPDSVLAPPGAPRILRVPADAPGVVSLRLSVPVDETAAEAGAGRVLQELALRRMQGPAAMLGARVEAARTPWGLAYTVSGPVADLDYLAYLLREAARAPDAGTGALRTVVLELDEELRRLEETGNGRVEGRLRSAVAGDRPDIQGTRGSLAALTPSLLRDVWGRTHRPGDMTLLVAGDVADPVLLASLAGLGAGPGVTAPPRLEGPAPSSPTPGRVQTLRRWFGRAWATAGPLDPRAAVAAAVLARRLREGRSGYEAEVRLWETPQRTLLAVVGGAYPRDAAALSRRLDGLLEATASSLDDGEVREVAQRIRRDLILQARTPRGRVHLVGRFLDAGRDDRSARAYLDALDDMGAPALEAFLRELAATTPFTAEVRP